MEKNFAILTDTGFDIIDSTLAGRDIKEIPFSINFKDKSYFDKIEISKDEIYEMMERELPKTSASSVSILENVLNEIVEKGIKDVLVMSISSKLSGMHNMMRLVCDDYDNLNVRLIDTKNVSMASGMYLKYALDLVDEGKSFDEVCDLVQKAVDENRAKLFVYFHSLDNMIKGGRISKLKGTLANILSLRPILSMDDNGEFFVVKKVKKSKNDKNALDTLRELAEKEIAGAKKYYFSVGYTRVKENALQLEEAVTELKNNANYYQVESISPTLGVHAGDQVYLICMMVVER